MAKVIAGLGLGIVGTIDELSIYRMRGVDQPIIRRKGGPTKEKIKTDPELRLVRDAMSEFSGRATAGGWIMAALVKQKPLADYNIAGPLNALMIPVQKKDSVSLNGERHVRLSAYPQILNGFNLNRNNTFDSTVRFPVDYEFDRETAAAAVQVPELIPGVSFFAPEKYPWFSVQVTLGVVPDILFNGGITKKYDACHLGYYQIGAKEAVTDWHPVAQGAAATTMEVKYDKPMPDEHFTLVLAIGVRYGMQQEVDYIRQAKHAGCAKVLVAG